MKGTRRRVWTLFALASAAVLLGLAWITHAFLDRERARAEAAAEALYHEDLRTVLWRMESRLAGMLSSPRGGVLDGVDLGSKGTPIVDNRWIDPVNREVNPLAAPRQELLDKLLGEADRNFRPQQGVAMVPAPPPQVAQVAEQEDSAWTSRGQSRSQQEFQQRAGLNTQQYQVNELDDAPPTRTGEWSRVWDECEGGLHLYLVRRQESGAGATYESYRLEWEALSSTLLQDAADLFPGARLEPMLDPQEQVDVSERLAAIPARLIAPRPPVPAGLAAELRLPLASAWIAALLAILGGGLALRSSLAFGERHRRFTQAVTHELRSPLTTFRMYSEMLSKDMVPEENRAEYFATLEVQADRLDSLVDNVLRYARLEEGRQPARLEPMDLRELLERLLPDLERRCSVRGANFEGPGVEPPATSLTTDPGAVGQILANLVDNACKYGASATGAAAQVKLEVALEGGHLLLDVSDAGPGVGDDDARRIFEAFERATRHADDPSPGVGLGLALSRGLARELGGELSLVQHGRPGATFRLRLPCT